MTPPPTPCDNADCLAAGHPCMGQASPFITTPAIQQLADDVDAVQKYCGDKLNEKGWESGFSCTEPIGHDGPHRDDGGLAYNTSMDIKRRTYDWVMEWKWVEYGDDSEPERPDQEANPRP